MNDLMNGCVKPMLHPKKWRRELFRSAALHHIAWLLPPHYPLHLPLANRDCFAAAVRILATLYYREHYDKLVASVKIARLCMFFNSAQSRLSSSLIHQDEKSCSSSIMA